MNVTSGEHVHGRLKVFEKTGDFNDVKTSG
jgi:hypothetical protein